jgi:hypothetical protein
LTPQEAFSDAADDAEMEMERIAIFPSGIDSSSITARKQRFPSDVKWGLDSKKNLLPPLRENFVLDIPFHRTLRLHLFHAEQISRKSSQTNPSKTQFAF